MNVTAAPEGEVNLEDNHRRLLGHRARLNLAAAVAHGKDFSLIGFCNKVLSYMWWFCNFSDPSPGRQANPPIECAPRPQSIRRQSSTTEEILIARGFRRQSTTEEMIRCRNFRRQSSQSDDVCQRFVISAKTLIIGCLSSVFISLLLCFHLSIGFSDIEEGEVRREIYVWALTYKLPKRNEIYICTFWHSSSSSP